MLYVPLSLHSLYLTVVLSLLRFAAFAASDRNRIFDRSFSLPKEEIHNVPPATRERATRAAAEEYTTLVAKRAQAVQQYPPRRWNSPVPKFDILYEKELAREHALGKMQELLEERQLRFEEADRTLTANAKRSKVDAKRSNPQIEENPFTTLGNKLPLFTKEDGWPIAEKDFEHTPEDHHSVSNPATTYQNPIAGVVDEHIAEHMLESHRIVTDPTNAISSPSSSSSSSSTSYLLSRGAGFVAAALAAGYGVQAAQMNDTNWLYHYIKKGGSHRD